MRARSEVLILKDDKIFINNYRRVEIWKEDTNHE